MRRGRAVFNSKIKTTSESMTSGLFQVAAVLGGIYV
jgi:hypothetical protein